jgi:hypothetical protein
MCNRSQTQQVTVTNISGNTISISPGLYMPNWTNGQKPQVSYASNFVTLDGIEAVSLNHLASAANYGVMMMNCNQCWVKGVSSAFANRSHISIFGSVHSTVQDTYVYQNQSHASVSYGIEFNASASDNLVQNNICQQVTDSCPSNTGGGEGNVAGYNYAVDDDYTASAWMQPAFYQHSSGDAFELLEGNIGTGYIADNVHGTHHFGTLFRNFLIGWQNLPAGCTEVGACNQTDAIQLYAGSRYYNIIGNVLGKSGYHNNYACVGSSDTCPEGNSSIYTLGFGGNGGSASASGGSGFCTTPSCSATAIFDAQTTNYLMRWGNYDTVTGAVRWCGNSSNPGWGTTCGGNSEVPTSIAAYSNSVPASTDLPDSFYLSAKPAWFGNNPYPPIGPDVAGGNISGLGGHANMNPAMACFINTMKGPPDGSGGVLSFNASACYGGSVTTQGPPPPTSLTATVQ